MHSICVWDMIKQSKPLQTRYGTTYIYDRYYIRTHVYVFLFSVENACLNYREFDLEGDLVGVPRSWYISAQSFISLLKFVWREYDIVAMNEWKKKCVGLQWTWVSKRTVSRLRPHSPLRDSPTVSAILCIQKCPFLVPPVVSTNRFQSAEIVPQNTQKNPFVSRLLKINC